MITNNYTKTYIGLYKSKDINNAVISGNTITNGSLMCQADDNGGPWRLMNVTIKNNTSKSVNIRGGKGGENVTVAGNSCVGSVTLSCWIDTTGGKNNFVDGDGITWLGLFSNYGTDMGFECLGSEPSLPTASLTAPVNDSTVYQGAPVDSIDISVQAVSPSGDYTNWTVKYYIGTAPSAVYNLDGTGAHSMKWKVPSPVGSDTTFIISAKVSNDTMVVYTEDKAIIVNKKATGIILPTEVDASQTLFLYPNPVNDNLTCVIDDEYEGNVIVNILGLEGNVIASKVISKKGAKVSEVISTSDLKPGFYLIQVVMKDKQITMPVLKK